MPTALILSSYVAASRIGGAAQQLALAALGVDPVLVPTVLFGASPATGARGRAVDADLFADLLAGVEAQGVFARCDLVITGHFSLPEQVGLAAQAIAKVRAAARRPIVVVDPILGDEPRGLYVKPEVAAGVTTSLVLLADWITPNAWELRHLSGAQAPDAAGLAAAARAVGRPALVTSVPAGADEIGLLLSDPDGEVLFTHTRAAQAPNGTGDLVTAVFGAGLVQGLTARDSARRAAAAVADAVQAAEASGAGDLPLAQPGARLAQPAAEVRERLLP